MQPNDPRLEIIADWLEKQTQDNSITDGTIWHQMALGKRTFYRLKPKALEILNTRLIQRQKELERIKLQDTIEAAKKGLKSKSERVLFYQEEIDILIKQLKGHLPFAFKAGNKLNKSHNQAGEFMVPIDVQNELREQIKSYQSEISKIEGDYAPKKLEVTELPNLILPGE